MKFILSSLCGLSLLAFSCKPGGNASSENATTLQKKAPENSVKAHFASQGADVRNYGGDEHEHQASIEEAKLKIASPTNNTVGYWVGDFGSNMINIALSEVDAKTGTAKGHSVCAGNYREIKGTVKENAGVYSFVLKEPGDDKYDGTFTFSIDPQKGELSGSWEPYKKEGNTPKKYSLKKRTFTYNASAGQYPNTSTKALVEDDLIEYGTEDLRIMRNEIYARHGYAFKNKDMRLHFEKQSWYIPVSVDVRKNLTDIEVKNIDVIYKYEEYYKNNYDNFGR